MAVSVAHPICDVHSWTLAPCTPSVAQKGAMVVAVMTP